MKSFEQQLQDERERQDREDAAFAAVRSLSADSRRRVMARLINAETKAPEPAPRPVQQAPVAATPSIPPPAPASMTHVEKAAAFVRQHPEGVRTRDVAHAVGQDTSNVDGSLRMAKKRGLIERRGRMWLIGNGWLTAKLKGRIVTLTAYPGTHNTFTREIDLSREFPGAYPDNEQSWDRVPVYVDIDREHCALAVGTAKKMDDRNHIHLVDVLFVD